MQQSPIQVARRRNAPSNRWRPVAMVAALALALTSVGAGAFSLALFTSTATVGSNTFTTGTIVLTTNPATALIGFTGMLPGDSVTSALTVTNGGTGDLRYAMTSASTNTDTKNLRDQLTLVVKTKDTNTAGCSNFNGTQIYTGSLANAAFGDVTAGSQTGDRTLTAPSGNEILCFQATLPLLTTGNGFQNATTTSTFTFTAEQTANN